MSSSELVEADNDEMQIGNTNEPVNQPVIKSKNFWVGTYYKF